MSKYIFSDYPRWLKVLIFNEEIEDMIAQGILKTPNKALAQFKQDCLLSPHLFAVGKVMLRTEGHLRIDLPDGKSIRWYKMSDGSFMRTSYTDAQWYSKHGRLLQTYI